MGEDWSYFVVLSDAYLHGKNGEMHIRSFDDLQGEMRCGDGLQALQVARASGELSEGSHQIPDVVASCLTQSGSDYSSVRKWFFGIADPSTKLLLTSDLASAWSGSNIEKIEVVDQFAQWYFRMKDDEAVIFLAVRGRPLSEQIKRCSAHCREVNSEFEYAQ